MLDSLKPSKVPRVRQELLDADYLGKLSKDELLWYAKFMDEYVGANITKNKETNRVAAGHLHRRNDQRKAIFKANNDRNNDVHSVNKANNLLYNIETQNDGWYIHNAELTELATIANIDNKKIEEQILTREEYEEVKDILTPEVRKFYKKIYR